MADYKSSNVSGTSYIRASRINIENPLNATPSVLFAEEQVINLGENTDPITRLISNVSMSMTDPNKVIELRDVNTWELTGQTTTIGQIYQSIASVYWALALERDSQTSV